VQLKEKSDQSQRPPVLIKPTRGWRALDISELWRYRELLYFLTWRDVKVRYKQTVLGAAWAVLQPFLLMVVFSVFLGRLAGVPSDDVPYPLFAYAGLVPWALFASALNGASESVVGQAQMVSKVYFPRLLMPIAAAGSFVLDFVIAFSILIGMMFFYGMTPMGAIVLVPLLTLLALMAALGVGILFAAVNVRYRDVRYAVPFLTQVWLFATPVAYPSSIVPEAWRPILGLNPMSGVVEGFRWALLGSGAGPGPLLAVSTGAILAFGLLGVMYFRRMERTFADLI
jgi:lipopolysaccharide transport system permease protein